MKKIQEHLLHMFGGIIIASTLIGFFGMLFQAGMKLSEIFGWQNVVVFSIMSYILGWAFFRRLDRRIKENSTPHMIHYHIDDIKGPKKGSPNE